MAKKKDSSKMVAGVALAGLAGYAIYQATRPAEGAEGVVSAGVELTIREADTGESVGRFSGIGALPVPLVPGVAYTADVAVTNNSRWRGDPISYSFLVDFNYASALASGSPQQQSTQVIAASGSKTVSFPFTLQVAFNNSQVDFTVVVRTPAGAQVVGTTKSIWCGALVALGALSVTAQVRGNVVTEATATPWLITTPDEYYKAGVSLRNNYSVSKTFNISALAECYLASGALNNSITLASNMSLTLGAGLTTTVGSSWPTFAIPNSCSGGSVLVKVSVYEGGTFITDKVALFYAEAIVPSGTVILT